MKPDDVQQWAWGEAKAVFDILYDAQPDLEGGCEHSVVEMYARALMKAKAEAYEEATKVAWGCGYASPGPHDHGEESWNDACNHVAAAIRKLGNPS